MRCALFQLAEFGPLPPPSCSFLIRRGHLGFAESAVSGPSSNQFAASQNQRFDGTVLATCIVMTSDQPERLRDSALIGFSHLTIHRSTRSRPSWLRSAREVCSTDYWSKNVSSVS